MNENFCSLPLPLPIAQLIQAWNTHDAALLAECLRADYESIQPHHPERNFWGRVAAVQNWQAVFEAVPDLHAELMRWAVCGAEVWTEWRWSGSHLGGNSFCAGGVIVYGLSGVQIAWARVYTEIEQTTGPDWDAVLDEVLNHQSA
jgi:hypothetical protein